jgi:nitroreductase
VISRPNPTAGTITAVPDFFETVLTQRAARSFGPGDVDDAAVAKILTAATHAPSAENSQPFVFVVVRDPAIRATIGDITARIWEGGARAMEVDRLSPKFLDDVNHGAMGGVAAAPVLIVVCGDTRLTFANAMDSSLFPAVQNLLLAAHALGLGSTLTTLPTLGDELTRVLGLPPEVVPVAVVPIGHLAKPLGPPRRQPISEKAHLNRYGTPFSVAP